MTPELRRKAIDNARLDLSVMAPDDGPAVAAAEILADVKIYASLKRSPTRWTVTLRWCATDRYRQRQTATGASKDLRDAFRRALDRADAGAL